MTKTGTEYSRGFLMRSENAATQVKKRYQGKEGKVYHQKHDVPQAAHKWIARNRAEKLVPYINPDDIVLEYGVGPGWNLEAIGCQQRLGYDLATFLEKPLAAKGIRFVADIKTVPDVSIDTIICHHVLEHTLNPTKILGEIKRMLKDDGRLVLIVPYEKERKCRSFTPNEPNHHLYSWNVQTLGNLVNDMGFSIQQSGIGRYGYDRFLAVLALRLKIGAAGFRWLKKLALAVNPLWEVRIVANKKGLA